MTRKNWTLIAALSLGLSSAIPAFAQRDDRNDRRDYHRDTPRAFEEGAQLKALELDELPRDVRETFLREKGAGQFIKIVQINRPSGTFYRASIQDRDGIRAIYTNAWGRILADRDIDVAPALEEERIRLRDLPNRVQETIRRQIGNRRVDEVTRMTRVWYSVDLENGRTVYIDPDGRIVDPPITGLNDRIPVRAKYLDLDRDFYELGAGRELRYDDLPGPIKETIGRERGQDRVTQVVRIDRGREPVYLVTIESPGLRTSRLLKISPGGRLLAREDLTREGHLHVRYDDLPGPVKDRLSKESQGHIRDYRRIVQMTDNGRTWYVGQLVESDGNLRNVVVTSEGRLLHFDPGDLDRPDRPDRPEPYRR